MFQDAPPKSGGPRPLPVGFSLLFHGALLALVAFGPARVQTKSQYTQVIAGKEKKLVWYRFRKLPEVSPLGKLAVSKPPQTEKLNPTQTIISKPAKAEKAEQMVWRPAPRIELKKNLTSPNLLAFRPVLVAPPPPKTFTPAPVKRPVARAEPLPEAPALQARADLRNSGLNQTRKFIPPPVKLRAVWVPAPLPEAPAIRAAGDASHASPLARGVAAAAPPPILEAGPNIADAMPSSHLNVAVVGLNPAENLTAPLPEASRPGVFSAGPKPSGRTDAGGQITGSQIALPDLTIQGGGAPPKPTLLARASPTSRENLAAAAHAARFREQPVEPPQGGAVVSPAPDPQWDHRDVYTLDVQMPNITSYAGSWIMWFAERQPAVAGRHDLRLPVPLRKVDPRYIVSAVEERVEGKVQLAGIIGTNGRVDGLRLLKGIDPRLDQSAAEALLKWVFEPASLNGTPVDVDLIVEIPFHLAPRTVK